MGTLFSTTGTVITPITSHSEPLGNLIDGSYAYYALCQETIIKACLPACARLTLILAPAVFRGTVCANGLPCTIIQT